MSEMSVVLKIVAIVLFVAIVFVILNAARREHARRTTPRRQFRGDDTAFNQVPPLWIGADDSPEHRHDGHHGHHHHGDAGGAHHGAHGGHAVGGFDGGHSGGGFDGGHAGGGH